MPVWRIIFHGGTRATRRFCAVGLLLRAVATKKILFLEPILAAHREARAMNGHSSSHSGKAKATATSRPLSICAVAQSSLHSEMRARARG